MNGGGQGRLVGKIDEKKKKGRRKRRQCDRSWKLLISNGIWFCGKKKIKREGKDKKKGKGVQPEIIRKLSSFVPS